MAARKLTQAFVKSILNYDIDSGDFYWLPKEPSMFNDGFGRYTKERNCKIFNSKFAGKLAGNLVDRTHIIISINYTKHEAHRLAWFYITGYYPKEGEIDHIDRNPLNNKFSNLRLATIAQQNMNQSKFKTKDGVPCSSIYKGVSWNKGKQKWRARIVFDKKEIHLGYFIDEKEAALAYDEAATKFFGEFAVLNFEGK